MQTAFNYEELGHTICIIKPAVDTKAEDQILSRLGVSRAVDFLVSPTDNIRRTLHEHLRQLGERSTAGTHAGISCLLVDEVQFLTAAHIDELFAIAVQDGIPVICYGIRTDFQAVGFAGSRRILEIAHSIEELKTLCRCGKKAILNARLINNEYVFDGAQVAIDGETTKYHSLCGACFLSERTRSEHGAVGPLAD